MVSYASKFMKFIEYLNTPIVVFQGGLGNQLSQWSFAHSISGSKYFSIDPLHKMSEIQSRNFELEEIFRNCDHIKKDKSGKLSVAKTRVFFHLLDRMWEYKSLRFFVEIFGYFREDPRIDQGQSSKAPNSIRYAKGYFQKQKNVESIFDSVRKEIIPLVDRILPGIRQKFDLASNYTVVHVRRGDYEAAEFTPTIIGTLSDEYFVRGMHGLDSSKLILLTENREDVTDLVIKLNPLLVLDRLDTTPWETLTLMYGASFLLGCNSSLSWWGARLCSARGGQVWLPSQWSHWKNINATDYHFPACNIADVYWTQDSLET